LPGQVTVVYLCTIDGNEEEEGEILFQQKGAASCFSHEM
jgi:hypothetical protein